MNVPALPIFIVLPAVRLKFTPNPILLSAPPVSTSLLCPINVFWTPPVIASPALEPTRTFETPVLTNTPADVPTATLFISTADAGFWAYNALLPMATDLLPNIFVNRDASPIAIL